MIRINLLPVRAAKKKETVRLQLTVAGMVTFLVVAVSFAFYLTATSEASSLKADIKASNDELSSLKAKIGELAKIKEQKRVVEEKLNIVGQLEAARTGPTRLFSGIGEAIPNKAWLSSVADQGAVVILTGHASSDDVVADFMRGLERHTRSVVELEVAQRAPDKETGTDVVNFTIRLEKERKR